MQRARLLLMIMASLIGFTPSGFAVELTIVDAKGEPVPDVVLTWKASEAIEISSEPEVIDQIDRQFVPQISAIYAGQRVDFPNSDNIRHHVYSFSESNPFEIKLYRNRPAAPIKFARPGVVALGCNIHDQMIGYIYVADTRSTVVLTDENGKAQVPGSTAVSYWHPRLSLTSTKVETITTTGEPKQVINVSLLAAPQSETSTTFGSDTFGSN